MFGMHNRAIYFGEIFKDKNDQTWMLVEYGIRTDGDIAYSLAVKMDDDMNNTDGIVRLIEINHEKFMQRYRRNRQEDSE